MGWPPEGPCPGSDRPIDMGHEVPGVAKEAWRSMGWCDHCKQLVPRQILGPQPWRAIVHNASHRLKVMAA